jgi:CheY-like chemotaxis protein
MLKRVHEKIRRQTKKICASDLGTEQLSGRSYRPHSAVGYHLGARAELRDYDLVTLSLASLPAPQTQLPMQHLNGPVGGFRTESSSVLGSSAPAASLGLVETSGVLLPPLARATNYDPATQPILVADDDADDTYFIQRLIKKTGVPNPVKTFDDGTEVVNYLGGLIASASGRRHAPLLLFLDLKMAGLGGFEFLEWARAQKGLMPLTMVVLSNSNASEDVARALELGAHRYLVKYPCVQTITTIVRSVYPVTVF